MHLQETITITSGTVFNKTALIAVLRNFSVILAALKF